MSSGKPMKRGMCFKETRTLPCQVLKKSATTVGNASEHCTRIPAFHPSHILYENKLGLLPYLNAVLQQSALLKMKISIYIDADNFLLFELLSLV